MPSLVQKGGFIADVSAAGSPRSQKTRPSPSALERDSRRSKYFYIRDTNSGICFLEDTDAEIFIISKVDVNTKPVFNSSMQTIR